MKDELLSKIVSHALRHAPQEYGLALDGEGWVDTVVLVEAIGKLDGWAELREADLERMIANSAKQRHEIRNGRIRALYGHSVAEEVQRTAANPPEVLFHGTAPETADLILSEGLQPMARQNVHLSADLATAEQVGKRKSRSPVLLRIDAARAHGEGVVFYQGNESVWLADHIPAGFISRLK